jgi:LacI family transcriptional regulator
MQDSAYGPKVYVQGIGNDAHSRRILEGVAAYGLSQSKPWVIKWGPDLPSLAKLREDAFDAVIVFAVPEAALTILLRNKFPVVKVGSMRLDPGVPHVIPDNRAIGRLAAAHFLERLYLNFAFIGIDSHLYSRERLLGFQEGLGDRSVAVFTDKYSTDMDKFAKGLRDFIRDLPPRCAVLGCNDIFAARVIGLCRELGLRVPEDRAVMGVDDDHLLLLAAPLPFTSVDPNSREIGRQAAQRLQGLLEGRTDDGHPLPVPPGAVIARASTDYLGNGDAVLARAMQLIREQACKGLAVPRLCKTLGVGRRMLEMRFQEACGQGPDGMIRRVRMQEAARLLADSSLQISQVGQACGYDDPLYFSKAFRKATGINPREWRKLPAEQRPGLKD